MTDLRRKHPTHDPDRCCRVCHATTITEAPPALSPPLPPAERRAARQKAKVANLVARWLPGTVPDWRHNEHDSARTRTGAGLRQLHESTGERNG